MPGVLLFFGYMSQIFAALAPKRNQFDDDDEKECVREVRAELVSLGGAIILAVAIVLTIIMIMVLMLPMVNAFQLTIVILLTLASWIYLLDSCTERLRLIDHSVEFSAVFSRKRHIPINELQAMFLVHEGFNLDRGIESIEFRRVGEQPDKFSLGPCWQRHKLEAFLHSVEEVLSDPHLFDEV